MPPTLRDVKQRFGARLTEIEKAREVARQVTHSAALSAEKLLGDPNWDRYLMRCQALLDEVEAARVTWLERCAGAVSENDRIVAQFNYHACDARCRTLKEVMALPHELINADKPTETVEPLTPTQAVSV